MAHTSLIEIDNCTNGITVPVIDSSLIPDNIGKVNYSGDIYCYSNTADTDRVTLSVENLGCKTCGDGHEVADLLIRCNKLNCPFNTNNRITLPLLPDTVTPQQCDGL